MGHTSLGRTQTADVTASLAVLWMISLAPWTLVKNVLLVESHGVSHTVVLSTRDGAWNGPWRVLTAQLRCAPECQNVTCSGETMCGTTILRDFVVMGKDFTRDVDNVPD